jgi:pantothenate kinase-related protein Tda10
MKKNEKELIYTLTFGEIPKELNQPKYFQKLSRIDSLILLKGDKILDSLKWNNFKKSKGASGFIIEVN